MVRADGVRGNFPRFEFQTSNVLFSKIREIKSTLAEQRTIRPRIPLLKNAWLVDSEPASLFASL